MAEIDDDIAAVTAALQPPAEPDTELDIVRSALQPKQKPNALQRFTKTVQGITESLQPPIVKEPVETVRRAIETVKASKTTERERLRGVFKPVVGEIAGEVGARGVSALRTAFGVPFEAVAPPVVTEKLGQALEFVGEKAEAGALKLGFSENTARAIGEIAPDVAAIGVPVAGKAAIKRVGRTLEASRTKASPDVRQPTKATAPEPPVEARPERPGAPERGKLPLTEEEAFVKDLIEKQGEPPTIETTPGQKGVSPEQGKRAAQPVTRYLIEDGAEPRVITEGSVDVQFGKNRKGILVEIDHLGAEPKILSSQGVTFESGKGRFAQQIAGLRARTQNFTQLERSIGEKTSSKQVENFPDQYVDKGLALEVQTNITNTAVGFMIRNKIVPRPDVPVTLQLVKAMAENPKLNEAFAADLQKVGITREQFLKSYVTAKSIAGKTLADLSVAERRLRNELGPNNPLVKELSKQRAELSGWDLGWHYFNRWTDVWRGSLVTRVKTAVRNLETQVVRLGMESIEGAMDGAIRKTFNLGEKSQAPSMRPIFDVFKTLVSKDRIKTAEKILELNPDIKDNMFRRYTSDVAFDPEIAVSSLTRLEKVTKGAETVVRFQNTMNWWQEFLIRKTAFYDELARRLDSKGLKIDKIDPKKIDIKDLTAASEHALEVTFAKTPTGNIGKAILNLYKVIPPLKLIAPFARFMINSWDFVYQRNPAAFMKFLSKAERAKLKAGDTRTLTKAITGSALTLAAYQLRRSEAAGDKWYEIKAGGRTWDMRPFNPFASYLFIGDLMDKSITGTLDELSGKELVNGLFSANFRAGGGLLVVEAVGDIIAGLLAEDNAEKAADVLKKFAGETLGGFLTQFRTVKAFVQAFSEEESKLRDKRDSPFLGPLLDPIPGVSRILPERQFPLGKVSGAKTEIPVVSELTGVLGRTKTAPQEEASRLRLTLRDLQRGTGISKLDRLTAEHARPRAERRIKLLIKSPGYNRLSDPEKVVRFKAAMNSIINSSRNIILSRRENKDLRIEFKQKRKGKEKVKAEAARRERLGR